MKLEKLIHSIHTLAVEGDCNKEITHVESDSRRVQKGSLFVAVKGSSVDGHQYIDKAIELGASAIVCESLPTEVDPQTCYLQVRDSNEALGRLASCWYGNPSQQLKLVGVTGTNGKTTVATVLYDLYKKLGYKAGLLSTVCYKVDDELFESTHTTPDPLTLNSYLAKIVEKGCDYAFMEVSSHALDQKRVAGLQFAGAIFTNLTRDHLDYHQTVDAYLKAKKSLFDQLPKEAFALSNADDKTGSIMLQNCSAKRCYYSLQTLADFHAKVIEDRIDGMTLQLDRQELEVLFSGRFNAYNLLAIYGAASLLGADRSEILIALSTLKPVSGRFETLHSPTGYTVIVDYAHTPDALNNVLTTINEVVNGTGKVITVVGAGGNRDKGKRPLMAQEAANASQTVVITSDNPRFEDPNAIIQDMLAGLNNEQMKRTLAITDRAQAIRTACMMAQPGDVVLIAGKGHENYQDIQGVKHHFDDKEEVLNLFN